MADVSRCQGGDGRGRDRGQILLVAGLAVAVTLVALVLLLNTVIYSQNLAARGSAIEDDQAVAFQQEAAAGVGEIVVAENREEYDDWEGINESVRDAIAQYDDLHSRYPAQRATVADIEEEKTLLSEGTMLRQNNSSRFTSQSGDKNWSLVESVSDVRNFRMNVSSSNLSNLNDDPFTVHLEGESDTRRVYVYSDDGVVVVSNNTDGSVPDACTASGSETTVNLTGGTVAGTNCPELDYPTTGQYDLAFRNGTGATGTYILIVNNSSTDTDVQSDNFVDPDGEGSPQALPVVYAAEFDIHFETPTLEYQTTVRVAPGEPE